MAKGACDAGLFPTVAVIGDSTFTHSGMTGLLDAVNEKTPITVIISDNESISMTLEVRESSGPGKNRIDLPGYRSRIPNTSGYCAGTQEP